MKQGRREAWWGRMWNEEHASASCILPSQHTQTNHPTIPQQRGDHHSTQMHMDNLSKGTERMPQNQANGWSTTAKTIGREKEVPCSAFRCARPLKEEANTKEKNREKVKTEARQYYSCIVIMHALHDGKPWQSLRKQSFPKSIWKLPWETDNYRAATYANIK